MKRLIWLYLALLVGEGAVRKWALPGQADALLFSRDLVALALYAWAIRARLFPLGPLMTSLLAIAALACVVSLTRPHANWIITAYGARCDFFHLPLVFLIPRLFDARDVRRVAFWAQLLAIPMAALMIWQFRANIHAAVNRTVDGWYQPRAAMGRPRPAGTFSWVTGPAYFFAVVTALSIEERRRWLALPAWCALWLACAVSGSRTLIGGVALVMFGYLLGIGLARPRSRALLEPLGLSLLALAMVACLGVARQGVSVLGARLAEIERLEGGTGARIASGFRHAALELERVPFFGRGLGTGTPGGVRLIQLANGIGERRLDASLVIEEEWSRLLVENGPAIAMLFLLWRTVLALTWGRAAFKRARAGELTSLALFSAGAPLLLFGPLGHSTAAGFTVAIAGLGLAALGHPCDTIWRWSDLLTRWRRRS